MWRQGHRDHHADGAGAGAGGGEGARPRAGGLRTSGRQRPGGRSSAGSGRWPRRAARSPPAQLLLRADRGRCGQCPESQQGQSERGAGTRPAGPGHVAGECRGPSQRAQPEGQRRTPAQGHASPGTRPGRRKGRPRRGAAAPPSASGHLLSEQGPQPAAGPGASWRRLRRASPDRGSPRVRGRGRAVEGPWGGPPPTALCRAPHVSCVSAKPPRQPPSHPEGTGAHGPGSEGVRSPESSAGRGSGFHPCGHPGVQAETSAP